MILEDATKEAFGYCSRDLSYGSNRPVLAACETCGKIRVLEKRHYHYFCLSCRIVLDGKRKGEKNPLWKPKIKCICQWCGKEFERKPSEIKNGGGKYCSQQCKQESARKKIKRICLFCGEIFEIGLCNAKRHKGKFCSRKCAGKAMSGENHPRYSCGKNIARNRATAKRKRELGYTLLMPLAEGEVGHHVTNEYVIGIPKKDHNSIGGRRKKHRTLVLQWLKANDKKKYLKVLCVLAKQ